MLHSWLNLGSPLGYLTRISPCFLTSPILFHFAQNSSKFFFHPLFTIFQPTYQSNQDSVLSYTFTVPNPEVLRDYGLVCICPVIGGGLIDKLCLTLFHTMDCSLPCSSVHGVSQARIMVWVAISFSRGFSPPRDQTWVSSYCCSANKSVHSGLAIGRLNGKLLS